MFLRVVYIIRDMVMIEINCIRITDTDSIIVLKSN